jgi:hypothetical protein
MGGNDYKRQILSILLDWHEASPAHARNQKPSRRRIMRLYDDGQTDYPTYDIESHAVREDVNRAVLDLALGGYVEYEWLRGQQNHILSKLWLNFGNIGQTYAYLGRRPKGDAADELLSRLAELKGGLKEDWARSWLEDAAAAISQKRSISPSLPEDEAERGDLLKAIACLADGAEIETLERVFSIRCFGDSKRFERSVKARLARILKKHLVHDDCTDAEALRSAGIVRYPEQFEFSGALSISLPNGAIDFSPLPFGGTLTIEDVQLGKISLGAGVRRVISIENRANYIEYVRKLQGKDEFALYHGGQFSPAKRVFLRAVASAMPDGCSFCHWGDIDCGGFRMLARLRREIFPDVRGWRMNEEELARYSALAAGFSDSYAKKLEPLLEAPELRDCAPCLETMLKQRIRLEQEAMLT